MHVRFLQLTVIFLDVPVALAYAQRFDRMWQVPRECGSVKVRRMFLVCISLLVPFFVLCCVERGLVWLSGESGGFALLLYW